jgi:DNA-damage-inducible protein J
MASLITTINVNVDKNVKEQANNLFNSLGLNMSTAINMFLRKAINEGGIPFEVNLKPSRELRKALKEGEDILSGKIQTKSYDNVDDLFKDLDNE